MPWITDHSSSNNRDQHPFLSIPLVEDPSQTELLELLAQLDPRNWALQMDQMDPVNQQLL